MLFVFSGAFSAALILTLIRSFQGKTVLGLNHAVPGFLLGLPNFISYKSILAALESFQHQGNVVFPIANLGVIILGSLVSVIYFRDTLSRWNLAGILISCLALVLLFRQG